MTLNAEWGKRDAGHGFISFNNKMWIIAGGAGGSLGFNNYNDVWNSDDGISWTALTRNAEFTPRHAFGCVSFNNKMWVIGGTDSSTYYNDVWNSTDGIEWTAVTLNAAFSARAFFRAFVYNNRMWITGGYNNTGTNNETWSSDDGVTWVKSNGLNISERFQYGGTTYINNNSIIIAAGYNSTSALNDVWIGNSNGTRTFTPTITQTFTPTITSTSTYTSTVTFTETESYTTSPTITETHTISPTFTTSPTETLTITPTTISTPSLKDNGQEMNDSGNIRDIEWNYYPDDLGVLYVLMYGKNLENREFITNIMNCSPSIDRFLYPLNGLKVSDTIQLQLQVQITNPPTTLDSNIITLNPMQSPTTTP